jgi:hypothetical protein
MKNIIKTYGGNPYQHLVDTARLAQKDGVIKGILLHQGESNNNDKQWPNKVKGIYDSLLTDLNLKPADVPLLAGGLVPADQKGACASMKRLSPSCRRLSPLRTSFLWMDARAAPTTCTSLPPATANSAPATDGKCSRFWATKRR